MVWREVQVARPVDDLAIGVVSLFSTERWPADQTFKHDSSNTPPIAALVIASSTEDLGCDVVGSANSRKGQLTTRLSPGIDLFPVGNCELDLVYADRVAILVDRFRTIRRHELLVV